MITSIEPKTGSWLLLVGPRSINPTLLAAIARLAGSGPVRVLDGGNRFNAYTVARAARGRAEALEQITISRAFTCYQALSLLESTPTAPAPLVVLDLLNTFYDESVQVGERRRLLRACIAHLERAGGGWNPPRLVVSVHPPAVSSLAAVEWLELLQASASEACFVQPPAPTPEPLRLF